MPFFAYIIQFISKTKNLGNNLTIARNRVDFCSGKHQEKVENLFPI